jgi:hypothetical protein
MTFLREGRVVIKGAKKDEGQGGGLGGWKVEWVVENECLTCCYSGIAASSWGVSDN